MKTLFKNQIRWTGIPALFTVLAAASITPAQAQGLAGEWRLDEGASYDVRDSSGRENNGRLADPPRNPAWIPGKFGSALRFDGDDVVRIPRSTTLESPVVTLEAWVRHLGYPGRSNQPVSYIAAKGGAFGCSSASYALYSRGGLSFYITNSSGYVLSPDAGPGVWDGNWHHVAGSYDGSAVRLFVDGSEVGTGTPTTGPIVYNTLPPHEFFIGAYADPLTYACSYPFIGDIDQVKVWTRALCPCEIAGSFSAATAPFGKHAFDIAKVELGEIRNGTDDKPSISWGQHVQRGRLALAQTADTTFSWPAVSNLNEKVTQNIRVPCHPAAAIWAKPARAGRKASL